MPKKINKKRKKILLADDHQPTRAMFSMILEKQNYQMIHASNGEQAYSKAFFEQPDLILMDVMMPVMDGYEALAKLKENPITQAIKVMMLTSSDSPIDRRMAEELGASGFLVKPVPLDELERDIKHAMANAA
ncbi:MAG: response regulator [Chloroflexi bacterium]|nr:response regulator [Chloroflexota bacterium]